jgi:hypothetical protein
MAERTHHPGGGEAVPRPPTFQDLSRIIKDAVILEIEGVRVPFASVGTLWRMKQTVRAKGVPDRIFLRRVLEAQGILHPAGMQAPGDDLVSRWLKKLEAWWRQFRHH